MPSDTETLRPMKANCRHWPGTYTQSAMQYTTSFQRGTSRAWTGILCIPYSPCLDMMGKGLETGPHAEVRSSASPSNSSRRSASSSCMQKLCNVRFHPLLHKIVLATDNTYYKPRVIHAQATLRPDTLVLFVESLRQLAETSAVGKWEG